MSFCFCTLAINAPYRRRARHLVSDLHEIPWIVLTDEPEDFTDLGVRAINHAPTGPMAIDYIQRLPQTGGGRGAAAYHDKRFALMAALEEFDTAIYVDADTRIEQLPSLATFPDGIAVLPEVERTIEAHLKIAGSWRMPIFKELATYLTGDAGVTRIARWCPENFLAVTKDGREPLFFEAWTNAADFLQARGVYSGEGGVIGLAAACAGWTINFHTLTNLAAAIRHESGGPKLE